MSTLTAIVTGASSGIGRELARELARGGHNLVLIARSADPLARLTRELREQFDVHVESYPCDLTDADAVRHLCSDVERSGVEIDILVNNAGTGLHGLFSEQDIDAINRVVALNVASLTALSRFVLPGMLSRRRGRIMNVASVAAYQPGGPEETVYYATKAYVMTFSRGLARELRGTGVTVTALCPGPVATAFAKRAGATATALYRWIPSLSAAAVARAGYRGMMRGSVAVIPGVLAKLMAFAGQLPPRRIALEVNRLLLRHKPLRQDNQ
jgi:uncharacterized protein